MRTVILLAAAVLALLTLPIAPASGGLLSQIVTLDGVEDFITDNSISTATDVNGNKEVDAGDIIFGIVRLTKNTTHNIDVSPSLGEVHIAFAFEILTGPLPGGPLGLSTSDLAYTLTTAPGVLATLLPSKGLVATDAFAWLSDAAPAPTDPTSLAPLAAFAALDAPGFVLDAAGSVDFVEATLGDRNADGKITLPGHLSGYEYAGVTAGTTVGSEAGGFSFSFITVGLGNVLPVAVEHLFPRPSPATTSHDATITAALKVPSGTQLGQGWVFGDQSDVKINLTPEPGAIVALTSLLLIGAGGLLYRRKRSA